VVDRDKISHGAFNLTKRFEFHNTPDAATVFTLEFLAEKVVARKKNTRQVLGFGHQRL